MSVQEKRRAQNGYQRVIDGIKSAVLSVRTHTGPIPVNMNFLLTFLVTVVDLRPSILKTLIELLSYVCILIVDIYYFGNPRSPITHHAFHTPKCFSEPERPQSVSDIICDGPPLLTATPMTRLASVRTNSLLNLSTLSTS